MKLILHCPRTCIVIIVVGVILAVYTPHTVHPVSLNNNTASCSETSRQANHNILFKKPPQCSSCRAQNSLTNLDVIISEPCILQTEIQQELDQLLKTLDKAQLVGKQDTLLRNQTKKQIKMVETFVNKFGQAPSKPQSLDLIQRMKVLAGTRAPRCTTPMAATAAEVRYGTGCIGYLARAIAPRWISDTDQSTGRGGGNVCHNYHRYTS